MEHNDIHLSNFKILQDSTDDNAKESYFKVVAEDNKLNIKVVRWLKNQDGNLIYYDEAHQIEFKQDSFALGNLVICQGCNETPCDPVLFKTNKAYHWSCDNLICMDCKKSQSIL